MFHWEYYFFPKISLKLFEAINLRLIERNKIKEPFACKRIKTRPESDLLYTTKNFQVSPLFEGKTRNQRHE